MTAMLDLVGESYGRLTVIAFSHVAHKRSYWKCKCFCGKETVVGASHLRTGNTTSCGCYIKDAAVANCGTHGLRWSKEYASWRGIKNRCLNPKNPNYDSYGGRGITICERWMEFENFYLDMGAKEPGQSIDRIDNDLGYSPENCKWSTTKEQSRNRRVTLKWNGVPLAQVADESGENYETLYYRFKKYGTPFPSHLGANHD